MLELKDISFSADGKKILNHINLKIDNNKFIVMTGPNGGGKSTLAKMIAGINIPTQGKILFDGEDITTMPIYQRAQKGVAFAFQQPVRFKGITVKDLIALSANQQINEKKMCGYLFDVGLCPKDYLKREVNTNLSGGEIKRIEIATVLARNAKLTIFDEPEAGIDLWSFNHLIAIFQKLREQQEGSILVISHQERILEIADEIIVLANGQISKHGPTQEILPELLHKERCKFCIRQEESI